MVGTTLEELEFTPLEFETTNKVTALGMVAQLEFTPLEFETIFVYILDPIF